MTLLDEKLSDIKEFKFEAKPQSICVVSQPDSLPPKEMFVGCNTGAIFKVDLSTS